jgi:Flp pilus assembly protein TadD
MAVFFSVGENVEAISTWKKVEAFDISATEARQIRKEVLKYPWVPETAYILADLHMRAGDLASAQAELECLTRARPNVTRYRVVLGDVLKRLGRDGEASACYEKALELSPADVEVRDKVVEYYSRAGR